MIERGDKNFTIQVYNKNTTVSIDRLKPAFVIPDDIEQHPDEYSAEPCGVLIYPETQSDRNVTRETRREENAKNKYVTRAGRFRIS
jgi:hypothetical protein